MLSFKTIEPSTQIALLVNPKKHPNFPKTDLDDAVDNAVSDFWKELEELENGKAIYNPATKALIQSIERKLNIKFQNK